MELATREKKLKKDKEVFAMEKAEHAKQVLEFQEQRWQKEVQLEEKAAHLEKQRKVLAAH